MTPNAAMVRGAVTALVVAAPVAVFNQLLISAGDIEPNSAPVLLFWLLILFGGAAGGWGVLRLCPEASMAHAAGSGAIAYVEVQSIGVILRLLDGDDISWLAYPFLLLMMATAAMLGGMFGRRWNRQGGQG